MNRHDIPVLVGVAAWIATLIGLLIWSIYMLIGSWLDQRRARRRHNEDIYTPTRRGKK